MKALEDRLRDLFTREQAAAMFAMVGPPEPPEGLPLPPGTRFPSRASRVVGQFDPLPRLGCHPSVSYRRIL
jgi:hypothetical protein